MKNSHGICGIIAILVTGCFLLLVPGRTSLSSLLLEQGRRELKKNVDNVQEEDDDRRHHRSAQRTKTPLIGEDCSSPDTACQYFTPKYFLANHTEYKHHVFEICDKMGSRMNYLGFLDCAEEEERDDDGSGKNSGYYCRPSTAKKEGLVGNDLMNLPRQFTFKWVRKTGGNSFYRAFNNLFWTVPHFKYEAFVGFGATSSAAEQLKKAKEHMAYIVRKQRKAYRKQIEDENNNGAGHSHPLVSIVRNPISRYISAVSMFLKHDKKEKYIQLCVAEEGNNTETLRCILKLLEDGLMESHTTPMFADIYCNTFDYDVQMSLYNMDVVPKILDSLLVDSKEKANKASSGFSVNDLDDDLIRRICTFYRMDVEMMESVGFPVPECKFDDSAMYDC